MDLGHLKSQIMTMFMMGGDVNKIYKILYTMGAITLVEYIFRHAPAAIEWMRGHVEEHGKKLLPTVQPAAPREEITASITLVQQPPREGQKTISAMSERVDAVMDHICSLDAAKHVRIEGRMVVANEEEIPLTPLIKAKVKANVGKLDEGIQIVIYSTRLPISQLRNWVDDLYERYVYERSNRLGNKTYYFNEIPTEPPKELDQATKQQVYRIEKAANHLTFTMNEFRTSKSFANVFGTHVDDLKERLDLFVNHPEWYMERGIPHSLGVLLHGVPGAGKTSTIKAIAADTNRHIFNLSLRSFTTQKQLDQLFYNELVYVQDETAMHIYRIPINRRVYVIEDIDCLTDVVLDREFFPREEPKDNRITLSYLLNLLDGVLETPGRILVITSNFPQNLDRALVRPGRIDVRIEFGYANSALIAEMVGRFYNTTVDPATIPAALDGMLTPAEVMECLCTHFRDQTAAMAELERKAVVARPAVAEKETPTLSTTTGPEPAPVPTITIEEVAVPLHPKIVREEDEGPLMRRDVLTQEDFANKSVEQLMAERDERLAKYILPSAATTDPDATIQAAFKSEKPKTREDFEAVHKQANIILNQRNTAIVNPAAANMATLIAVPDMSVHALFKQFENAKTDEEFSAIHKMANTFQDLQPFDPDAA